MNRKVINFVITAFGTYRTIMKTRHGRQIYLEVSRNNNSFEIVSCFYIDRNRGKSGIQRCTAIPLKLKTRILFSEEEFLSVIQTELDTSVYAIQFDKCLQTKDLNLEQFIRYYEERDREKYHFLILIGSGENTVNELPMVLKTRLKNQLHRSVYLELERYNDRKGVVRSCFYYDRTYQRPHHKVVPFGLFSCFFQYTPEGILNLVNNELNCHFNYVLIVPEYSVDVENDLRPLCGSL